VFISVSFIIVPIDMNYFIVECVYVINHILHTPRGENMRDI
jgi:hypothetical protein